MPAIPLFTTLRGALSLPNTAEANARWCVLFASALTLCVMLPSLAVTTGFGGDDWAWIAIFRSGGAAAVQKHLSEAAHPGYGPFLNLLLWLGGDSPFRLARAFVIPFHLANGWLLWRIFNNGESGHAFAATVAVLYLVAPFLAGLDQSFAHSIYDIFIFCYLLSIVLSRAGNVAIIAAAATLLLVGLSIETLAAIEPIRWWFIYQHAPNLRVAARRTLLFLAVNLIVLAARMTWVVPHGVFAGYNSAQHTTLAAFLQMFQNNLLFFWNVSEPLQLARALILSDSVLITAVLLLGTAAIFLTLLRAGVVAPFRKLALLAALGVIILMLGIAPYAAIERFADRADFDVRFAVASQFGAIIIIAAAIQCLYFAPLRALFVAAAVLIYSCVPLQLTKWMLHEELLLRDFRAQLSSYLTSSGPQVLVVKFDPKTYQFLYRRRACLSSYDINNSLELTQQRHGSFVYDADCGTVHYSDPNGCRFDGFEAQTCPIKRRSARYHLNLDGQPLIYYQRFYLSDLVRRALVGPQLHIGTLQID